MTCDEARDRFEDLLHDRLSSEDSQALRQHLSECPHCPEEIESAERIASLIRARASYHRAPEQLRASILQELQRKAGPAARLRRTLYALWTTPAALCTTTALVVLAVALPLYHRWMVTPPGAAAYVVREVARDHRRLLLNYPPTGTSPTDPIQIQQWFQETLGFSPPIHFWGNQDFRLLRGYPTYILDRRAACLLFKTKEIISTLYIFPGSDVSIPSQGRRQIDRYAPYLTTARDHRVLLWKQGELTYLVVSRLTDPELDQLFLRIRQP